MCNKTLRSETNPGGFSYKKETNNTMFVAIFEYEDWKMVVNSLDNTIAVSKKGFDETRFYDIPEGIEGVAQTREFPEYVRVDTPDESAKYYVFKFENDDFFVGDIWLEGDEEDTHHEEFAMHVFGEES